MNADTKAKLLAKRQEVLQKLLDRGIDYDDAMASILSAGANLDGLLEDQPRGEAMPEVSELVELSGRARQENSVEQQAQATRVEIAKRRIENGTYGNADLDLVVAAGLATYTFDDPESNRPTGIKWITSGNPYADQVSY